MSFEFGVLGPIEVRDGDRCLTLGGSQQRRILATLLAEHGKTVALQRLVEAMWPDAPPDGARRTVMSYVSRLRVVLGDGYVVTQEPGYRLVVADEFVEAVRFERLVEQARRVAPTQAITMLDDALALWRGRAFGEFADEWWALPHAIRLEELRIVASEERIDALTAQGAYDRAVADLEGLTVAYPLRERFVAQLMTAYDASGRQANALRAYASYRDYLAEETGLEPSAALHELEAAIVAGAGAGAAAGATSAPGGTGSRRGYTLDEILGEGAFGTVYRSTQPGVGREVAIKVIRADLADDPAFVRSFEAEAQLVAHLEHPHIVPLYDFWREPGGAYLVFRLLRGGTAEQLARREGRCALGRVDRCVTEIGNALAAAHAAGIVHRDVKPANVLFDEAGNSYLADFGIAVSAADDGPARTPRLSSAGSPLYAPPEQLQRGAPTARGDQYSFAAMTWELLAGHPPFDGDSASALLRTKLAQPVPSLSELRPDVPREIDAVLQRATASRPTDRFDDLRDLLTAWRAALRNGLSATDELAFAAEQAPARRDLSAAADRLADVPANPYKGLRAFAEADARDFHGRDALVDRLVDAAVAQRFVAVVGPSGSGKSSLVHAGLVPQLRARGERVVSMLPGDDPFGQLRLALLAVAVREPAAGSVGAMVRSVAAQGPEPFVVVIDQFEELWTLTDSIAREQFLTDLVALAGDDASASVRIVVTIRADFFDRPLAHPALGPLVAVEPFAITPMTTAELREAVVAPAAAVDIGFEPGLDTAIVAEVSHQPASLPTLQFTLAELFERRDGAVITRSAYDAIGGIAGAIAGRAEALYAALDETGRDAARRLLVRLVVPGDGTEDTRRRVRHRDLPAGTAAIAAQFEAHRLLVADRDPSTREPTVEVAHESLLRSWPRLRSWLLEDRDWLRRVQHVQAAADAWMAAGRPESELYRGGRLDAAAELLDTRGDQLTDGERAFVETSRDAADAARERDARARRRLRRGFVATTVALVVALVAGTVAFVQRHDANEQRHNANVQAAAADVARLVSLSQSLTGTKRDIAILLALEAARRDPGPATTGALEAALYSDVSFLGYVRTGTTSGGQLSFSPDGRTLYSASEVNGEPAVRIDLAARRATELPVKVDAHTDVDWLVPVGDGTAIVARWNATANRQHPLERVDLASGRVLGTLALGTDAWGLAVSPDRTRAVVSTASRGQVHGRVVVFNLATMRVTASIDKPGPATMDRGVWHGNAIWIDGHHLVAGSPSGRIFVWEPDTGRVVQRINDPPSGTGDTAALRLTADGRELVAAGINIHLMMGYDMRSGKRLWRHPQEANGNIFLDESAGLAWAQEPGFGSSRMFAFNLNTGERVVSELNGQHGTVCDVRVSPDGNTVAIASCNEGTIALWALDGRTATGAPLRPAGWASAADLWSPDGRYVAVFRNDVPHSLEVVDVRTGARQRAARVAGWDHSNPFFRRDGILQGVDADDRHVVEFDPTRGTTRDTGIVMPGTDEVSAAAEFPARHLTAYGLFDGNVVIVDTARGRIVRKNATGDGPIYGVGWNVDGTRVFSAGQFEHAEAYDVGTGKKVATLPSAGSNLVVSPDRTLMAVSAFNGTITFYDTRTLRRAGDPLTGGTAFTRAMQFTWDGRTLVTGGLDSTLRFFDVASRRQVGVSIPITSVGVAISPDDREIAATTERGVQRLSIEPVALRRAACRLADRNLTKAEWRQYVGGPPRRLCST
ncbi:MAG: putative Calcium/calmodulin-dependent protein kinase [Actinomycetia bacterium]|nr:putative Calcium/calmodulin-dependent protein kinase [Actinomycetes bacterium]